MYQLHFGLHRVTITGPEAARLFNDDRAAQGIPAFISGDTVRLDSHTTAPTYIIDTESKNTLTTVQRLRTYGANVK